MFRKLIELTRAPEAEVLARRELEDAKRSLLEAHSAVEYAEALVGYHSRRVSRLTQYLENL